MPNYWKDSDRSGVREVDAYYAGTGKLLEKEFFKGQATLGVRFAVWELPPGASEGDHTHSGDDDYEETYYFLSGEGVISIEGQRLPVRPGDAFLVPAGVAHGLSNTGSGPLRLVLLFGKRGRP